MSDNPDDHPSKRRRILPSSPKPNEDQEDNEIEGIFQGMRIYIHDRINPTRRRVLRSLITQHGGTNSINADENVTHILADENMLSWQLCHDLQWRCYIPSNIHVLVVGWVSACIHANRILNSRHFLYSCPRGPVVTVPLDSSNSENVEEDIEASAEDNGPRERKFAKPTFPRSAYENADNEERKFWSPLEDGSTFDDHNYNCETTCDDEWLLIPLPKSPECDPSSNTAENAEEGVENDDLKKGDLENNGLVDVPEKNMPEQSESKEDKPEKAKDADSAQVKKKGKKKGKKKSEDTAIYNPGPSTSSNKNLPLDKSPMVPFDKRPDNTVGRLSRLRLKVVPNPDGSKKKWVVVVDKPEENDPSPNEGAPSSTAVEGNLPGATSSAAPNHCLLETPSLNLDEDMQDPLVRKDKLSDDINLGIQTSSTEMKYRQGHKRKKDTASSEEQNEATNKETLKHKRKQTKYDLKSTLSDEKLEAAEEGGPAIQKRKNKTRLQKKKDENTSASMSSDEQDESTGKISIQKSKETCSSPNVQGETSNLVELPIFEERLAGKFPRRKLRRSISTPASPTSEGIGKLPRKTRMKNSSAPASPNIQEEFIEKLSDQIYRKIKQSKNTSPSVLSNTESLDFKMDENIPHGNPNSTNAIFDNTYIQSRQEINYLPQNLQECNISVDAENKPCSTSTNKKDEIRKYVTKFFSGTSPNNDGEYKKQRKRKRSTDGELHLIENSKENYSRYTGINSSVPLNLDVTVGGKAKQSDCQTTIERSDLNESLINVAPDQSLKSTLIEFSEPGQNNEIPTLAESNISAESASSPNTRSVIQFAKSALNCNSSASSVSHLNDLQKDEKTIDEPTPMDCPEDIKAFNNDKFNIVLGEEMNTNNPVIDEVSKTESINSTIEKSQHNLDSMPASPVHEEATLTIANLGKKVNESFVNEVQKPAVYPIELQCSINFDVQLRLSELFFSPKTDRVVAEINFLKAELERRKHGNGFWQMKDFDNFVNNKSESKEDQEERLRIKSRIGYWVPSINSNDTDAVQPILFQTDRLNDDEPINFDDDYESVYFDDDDEPINLPPINKSRSHDTPIVGRSLIFPLPEPSVSTPMPETMSAEVSLDGNKITKHFLSPMCPNFHIIQKLQRLYEFFKKTKDIWRMHAYEQAIFAVGKYPTVITSFQDALQVKGLGNKIAFKVWEIARSGKLQEIDEFCNNEWVTARRLLTKGWGITPRLARRLFRENLSNVNQVWVDGNLGRPQRIGLKYYEHLSKKMTRAEADEIAGIVVTYFKIRNNKVEVEACSSIRRNKKLCSYVSMLIVLPRGVKNGHRLLDDTVCAMHREAYLIDDLIRHEENGNQCRYSGIFQINDNARYRRLDLTVVPYIEQVCARFFLTGPSYFLRAMIKFAERSDMVLDEHCLRLRLLDTRGRTHRVIPLHLSTEQDIFDLIEAPYRSPEERDIIPFSTVVNAEL